MDYSGRRLIDVIVADMRSWVDEGADTIVGGEITLTLNNIANPNIAGPHIKARVGLPSAGELTLEQVEERFLDAAHALLRRLADEPRESLTEVYQQQRDDRNRPDPLADLHEKLGKITH
jgi:hypothetical protein